MLVPKEVNEAPRAPWWNYREEIVNWGNPSAEIIGYFYTYGTKEDRTWAESMLPFVEDYLYSLENYEFHELLCFLRLMDKLPPKWQLRLEAQLTPMIVQICLIRFSQIIESVFNNWIRLFV
jgi:hypothetical protein